MNTPNSWSQLWPAKIQISSFMIMNEQSHPEAVQNLDVHFGRTWIMIVSTIIHRVEWKNMFHILYRALNIAYKPWFSLLGSGELLEDLIHLGKLQCFHFARQFGLEMAMKTKCLINDNEVCPEHIMNWDIIPDYISNFAGHNCDQEFGAFMVV